MVSFELVRNYDHDQSGVLFSLRAVFRRGACDVLVVLCGCFVSAGVAGEAAEQADSAGEDEKVEWGDRDEANGTQMIDSNRVTRRSRTLWRWVNIMSI